MYNYIKFKIVKKDTKHYFTCFVFKTKKMMYEYYIEFCKKNKRELDTDCNFRAIVLPYIVQNKLTKEIRKDIGVCFFYKQSLGAGIISHEMLHCAMHYDRSINLNKSAKYGKDIGEEEERLAYILSEFTSQMNTKCYKNKLY